MARGKKTGGRNFKKGSPGRKKGSKDKVPRALKGNLKAVFEDIAKVDESLIREAVLKGLKAPAPKSFAYLQFLAYYVIGKPAETVNMNVDLSKLSAEQLEQLRGLVAIAQPT